MDKWLHLCQATQIKSQLFSDAECQNKVVRTVSHRKTAADSWGRISNNFGVLWYRLRCYKLDHYI